MVCKVYEKSQTSKPEWRRSVVPCPLADKPVICRMRDGRLARDDADSLGDRSPARPAWEHAYRWIKERILRMEIEPGELVSEQKVATDLGISRTPVREAINRLEQEGLIESSNRRKRAYVLRIHEIDEIFDLKKGIESEIARVATARKDERQTEELHALVAELVAFKSDHSFENLMENHDLVDEWLEIDERFHGLLYAMAHNRRAEQIVRSLNDQWHRLEVRLLALEGRLERTIDEHLEIAGAILGDERERAQQAMSRHLETLHATLANIMRMFHFPC